MHYARPHIKEYWNFAYRRALGISMMTFAIALAIGVTFSTLLGSLSIVDYGAQLVFWLALIAITAIVFLVNFAHAHASTVKFMNEQEHRKHTKYTGIWLIVLVIGAIAFTMPVLFFTSFMEPLMLLFGFGGIFWVLYFSVYLLFRHHYPEVAISALVFWIVFAIGVVGVNASALNAATYTAFALFMSIITLVVVCGFTGVSLITNASRELVVDFRARTASASRSRARRRRR
ncbi:MAG: hypothetical protein KGH60_00890 [Candidatus Micrarchaeota archaeon]|nr:hypothetical protein [Candidatus Micrarchaeota archaeon]